MRRLPALRAHRGGMGVNEPECSHNRNGASWSPPMLDPRSFGRTQTAGGVVTDENTVWLSPCRGGLCCSWPTAGCHTCWTRLVGMAPGGRARFTSCLLSSIPHRWCLAQCWEAHGPPSLCQCLFMDCFYMVEARGNPSTGEDLGNTSPSLLNVN